MPTKATFANTIFAPADGGVPSQHLLDNLTTAVFLVDAQLTISYLNPAAEELFQISSSRALGKPFHKLIENGSDSFVQRIQRSIREGHPVTQREITIRLPDKIDITVDCTVSPIIGFDRATQAILEISSVDRQLRIAREENLLVELKATQTMLRGLAHEIKNPLGGIRGAAQLLDRELENRDLREYTHIMIAEVDRLQKLVDRMLGPAYVPENKPVDIHNVLEHVRQVIAPELPNSVMLAMDYDPSIPMLMGDKDLLVQAILNIVKNAVRAASPKGHVILRTRVHRQYTLGTTRHKLVAQISVIDSGKGIPEHIKDQIFFPMVSGEYHGTGLGLSIAQALVNQHRGLIEFDSVPGCTEFKVILPVNDR